MGSKSMGLGKMRRRRGWQELSGDNLAGIL
jgi:hypothetical protein